MDLKNEVKGYIVSSGWTITQITDELNKRNNTQYTVQNLSAKIRRETLKYSEILQIADIIGYDIKWEKRKA